MTEISITPQKMTGNKIAIPHYQQLLVLNFQNEATAVRLFAPVSLTS